MKDNALVQAVHEIHVEVLGQLRARAGDSELKLGPSRQRAVFAVLAANAHRAVTRDELVDTVWGESAPASASGSVHTYISGLRRVLGAAQLATVPGGYQLKLSPEAVDVNNFIRLRGDATRLLGDGDLAAAVAALDEALALWHGEPYTGVPGPFAEHERSRLAEMQLAAVEQRARTILELGGRGELIAELTGVVRDHPLHEALYELLMRALAQAGRSAEALDVYQNARRILVRELGVEPGPALRRLQQQVLDGTVKTAPAAVQTTAQHRATLPVLEVVPAHVARARRHDTATSTFVGRSAERNLLAGLVNDVAAGRGGAVWIDGEPGIGKSELLTTAFARAGEANCQLAWGVADELGGRIPLRVIMEALGLETTSSDPRLAAIAERLYGDGGRLDGNAGPAVAAEGLLVFIREACTTAPLILIVDDMQWADEASLLLWGRLAAAARRLPLLLVAASRPEPGRRDLAHLRRALEVRDGRLLSLDPLSPPEVEALIGGIVGARIGESLRALATRTAGNPLYTREMATALVRQREVNVVDGVAEVDLVTADRAPETLLAAVRRTLEFLSPDTQEVLRLAALLGMEFAASEVVALTGRSPVLLVRTFGEAVAAQVVVESGTQLTFRHPFLRQALYDTIPGPLRSTLRRHAAEALARAGSPVTRIAEQLVAESAVVDAWVVTWLVGNLTKLAKRAPLIAADLLRQSLATDAPSAEQRETLLVAAVKLLYRLDEFPEAEARQALAVARDPADRAEMRQLLAAMRYRRGDAPDAIALLRDAVPDPAVPEIWRTRHRGLLATFRRGDLSDLDAAEHTAQQVYAEAVAEKQVYEAAFALQTRWQVDSIRRDHERALGHLDVALDLVRDDEATASLHYDLLDNRVFSLQNLDRLEEAQATLRSAAEVAARYDLPANLQVASAIQYYWLGRWDSALAEINTVTINDLDVTLHGTREPPAVAMLLHGVAALIASRRGDLATAETHLDAADLQLPATSAERESCDFLLVARAVVAEQQGRPEEALAVLSPLWEPTYAPMMLRHQWLPDIVRLALVVGSAEVAEIAAASCAEEEAKEVVPARAYTAAARVRALRTGDPEPALAAARHYRKVGRRPELAAALEDAAALLAAAGRADEAVTVLDESIELYDELGAAWDVSRARARVQLSPGGRAS